MKINFPPIKYKLEVIQIIADTEDKLAWKLWNSLAKMHEQDFQTKKERDFIKSFKSIKS